MKLERRGDAAKSNYVHGYPKKRPFLERGNHRAINFIAYSFPFSLQCHIPGDRKGNVYGGKQKLGGHGFLQNSCHGVPWENGMQGLEISKLRITTPKRIRPYAQRSPYIVPLAPAPLDDTINAQ